MKHSPLASLAATAAVVFLLTAPAVAAANLAVSSSFEEGIQGWTGWPSLPIERSTEFAHTGKYSVKFPQGEPASPSWPSGRWAVAGMQTIPYPVEPGGRYRCAIFVRADTASVTPAHISLSVATIIYDYNKPSVNADIPADGAWHEVSMEFTNPDFVKYLVVWLGTKGTVWVDDFSITEIAPPTPAALEITLDSPVYFAKGVPIEVTATLRNHTANPRSVLLAGTASLPDAPSQAATPVRGYGKLLKTWQAIRLQIPVGGTVLHKFAIDSAGLPETGVKIDIAANGAPDSASATREVFICQRPDWRTWFSVGAQCYTSTRFDGTWVKSLHDLGGDSVREGIPLPMSYRNAIPGQFTDYPLETRLNYYARYGIKWLEAYHTVINNGPAWLCEDPSNRLTLFDGTVRKRPALSYFAPKARAALMEDAELGGRVTRDCPDVFGVQIDNEINAIDDYGLEAQQSFREYIHHEFGTIAAVNAAWETSYTSFSDLRIPAPMYTSYMEDPTGGLDAPQPEKRIPAKDFLWLKWREDEFIRYYRDWTSHFKKTAPNVPVTDNFSLYVSALPRFYYAAPVNLFRFAEFFDIGGVDTGPSLGLDAQYDAYQFDLVNSAWGDKPVWIPEIYYDWEKADPHAVGFDLFYGMGRKVQHTNLFTWPVLADEWGGPYSSNLRRDRAYMLDNVKTDIAQARKINAVVPVSSLHYVLPSAGIYWSRDVHDLALAMREPEWLPGTDPLYDMDKVFTDLQYPVDFVDDKKLGDTLTERALFVTGAYALSKEKWNELLAYARRGGVLFLNGDVGGYDEHLQPYASSPCGLGSGLGITLKDWQSASVELFSNGASPLIKLGKGRKVRGFGRFEHAEISAEWGSLLKDASEKPGLVTRPYGKGRIYWSLTDIANPYATYQTSNTLFLIEGILEAAGIGRPVRVMDDTGTSPAPKVTIAVKRRTPTETYVFANNFGADGKFHFFVNAPMANLAITDMLSGANMTWSAVRGCAVFEAPLPKCGYGVYRIASAPFDVEHLPVRAVQTAPPPVAAGPDSAANLPIGTTAVLTEAKTTNGAPLYWLSSPFIRAAVVPERGGRVAYLSGAGTDVNNVLTPTGVFPPEGIVSSDDGGIKAVLDVNGATYPGITLARTFAVTGRTSTPSQASVSMQDKVDNLQIDQTFSVSQSDPALRVNVRQHSMTAPRNLRLYLHGSLLLNGQVNRAVSFAAGNSKQSVSMPYEIGMQAGRPVGFPADWGAVVDTMQHTAILCVLNKGYSHVTFWNGMRDYNFEAGSEFADTSATNPEEGQASFYVCRDIPQINFVTHGLAGYFAAYPEAGGQSIAVSICGLTGKPEPLDLVIIGVKQATKEEQVLGSFSIIAKPVTGSQQNLSLGGSGSGYDAYRLCLKRDGSVIPLKEVAGNVNSNAPANSADSAVAAWRGDEISLLTTPLRMPAAMPWTLEQGTVRVKFKTNATHDIVHHGVYLVNGYHGAVDHHLNRTSRLWLNIDGLAVWSPSAPMIFLMIYDKEGRRIHVTANATLRDDSWYELAAVWDAKAKTAALYLDGHPLKISEQVFPDGWNGAEPIESFEVGDAGCEIGGGAVLPIATTLTNQE